MEIGILYLLSALSILTGTAAIYMALIPTFPIKWLYYHYFLRKPIVWTILVFSIVYTFIFHGLQTFELHFVFPFIGMILAIILTYKMHQETAFQAVDYPNVSKDPLSLPLTENAEMAIIDYNGISKAYPLDYVIHHHIINDRFGDKVVALTYCAMCRSIIPFDVTAIGPLFVASFKNANMIVADKKTKTFFQQATFKSIIGPLHPMTLEMLNYQIFEWKDVKKLKNLPHIVDISKDDLREFELPIPGVWKKIVASEVTPGINKSQRNGKLPSRTRVIGVYETNEVYLKNTILTKKIIKNDRNGYFLVGFNNCVNGFKNQINQMKVDIYLEGGILKDKISMTSWDLSGKYLNGQINKNLSPLPLSDEYWFSWMLFHPQSQLTLEENVVG